MTNLFETTPPPTGRFARVVLERGIDARTEGLTYALPAALTDLAIGQRVLVPLGKANRAVAGYVTELLSSSDVPAKKAHLIKTILSRDPADTRLTPDLIVLARWIAGYYCCPLGMVLQNMLPAAVKQGTGSRTRTMVGLPPGGVGSGLPEHSASSTPTRNPEPGTRNSALTRDGRPETRDDPGSPPDAAPAKTAKPRKLSKQQQAVLDTARRLAGGGQTWVEIKDLADHSGAATIGPVKQLLARGLLIQRSESSVRPPVAFDAGVEAGDADAPPRTLNPDQERAVNHLAESVGQGFGVFLLHGITGSGKTEVYLQVIDRILKRAASTAAARHTFAIVLVPEIALTPQTVRRFTARFAEHSGGVAAMHFGLTRAQRNDFWRRICDGEIRIVIGTRSAVFAPLPFPSRAADSISASSPPTPGVIIVDEEHENSYKQDQLPRYHARDVAIKRAQILNVPVILGSATPSLESYYNATVAQGPRDQGTEGPRGGGTPGAGVGSGLPELSARPSATRNPEPGTRNSAPRYHLLRLPQRVGSQQLPRIEIVDMREERRKRYDYSGSVGIHLLSLRLEAGVRRTLEAGGQTMLLLNRRGYANYIACPDHRCGWMMTCDYCDVTMVYHRDQSLRTGGLVRCHHCLAEQLLPPLCPVCGKKVTVFGLGTQRVEEELQRKFKGVRVLRMDSDSMHTARQYDESLDSFRRGDVDVLIGTQMIAKGLDFPNVKLVGVISGDTALHMPDFRAAERTFQMIAQVAGRAGRSEAAERSLVIVQSFSPADPAIVLAARHDYEGFAQREIALRQKVGLPPATRMARIVVRDLDALKSQERAVALAASLRGFDAQLETKVRIRGPAPCPIARIGGFHRQQIELLAPTPGPIQRLLSALRGQRLLLSDARTAVDVDPVSLM